MARRKNVVIIGGGQAGLATSFELQQAGVDHVVLERDHIGSTWAGRWDSFCLVSPNWSIQLPSAHYDGPDPDGYLLRDDVVAYLERYAQDFRAPIREGVDVTALSVDADGRFRLDTSDGVLSARSVVVCSGAYERPFRPPGAASLPADLTQLDAETYTNPGAVPPGKVLIVGSGQTGAQLAEELHEAGREVFLSCGRAPWAPRRFADRDIFWWTLETGFFGQPVRSLPTPDARLWAMIQATGHGGGHDLHFRTLRALGVTLLGHFLGAEDGRAGFAPDLGASVTWGDERYRMLMEMIRETATERGISIPDIPEPEPFDGRAPETLHLSGFGAVLFTGGFRPDYGRWVKIPGAFDELGFPVQVDGASTGTAGLFFVGVHFLRTRMSSLLRGVGDDAAIVARQVAARG